MKPAGKGSVPKPAPRNRLVDMPPDWCSGFRLNRVEQEYLLSLATSERYFDLNLCQDYLITLKYNPHNRKAVIRVCDALLKDGDDGIQGQARICLEGLARDGAVDDLIPVISQHCSVEDPEVRRQMAIGMIESLIFAGHVERFLDMAEEEFSRGNSNFMDALASCWYSKKDLSKQQFLRLDQLISPHLSPERLTHWKSYVHRFLNPPRKRSKEEKQGQADPECVWHRPYPVRNRLFGREPIDFWKHSIHLNSLEKGYLKKMAADRSYRRRLLCLEFVHKVYPCPENFPTCTAILDLLIPDKHPWVRGKAIELLETYSIPYNPPDGWRLMMKYAESPSADIREQIGRVVMPIWMNVYSDDIIEAFVDRVTRSKRFADALVQADFMREYDVHLDALDGAFNQVLDPDRYAWWKRRLKLWRSNQMRRADGDQRQMTRRIARLGG